METVNKKNKEVMLTMEKRSELQLRELNWYKEKVFFSNMQVDKLSSEVDKFSLEKAVAELECERYKKVAAKALAENVIHLLSFPKILITL